MEDLQMIYEVMIPPENAKFNTQRSQRPNQWKNLPMRPMDLVEKPKDEHDKVKQLFDLCFSKKTQEDEKERKKNEE